VLVSTPIIPGIPYLYHSVLQSMRNAIIESTAKEANRTLRFCKLKYFLKHKPRTSLILIMSSFPYRNLTPPCFHLLQ
jgi:hypothetical protein